MHAGSVDCRACYLFFSWVVRLRGVAQAKLCSYEVNSDEPLYYSLLQGWPNLRGTLPNIFGTRGTTPNAY